MRPRRSGAALGLGDVRGQLGHVLAGDERGLGGVVCGHIHKAEIRNIDGVLYCNDGDWVESCTALVEHADGRLEIVNWARLRAFDMLVPAVRDARDTEPVAGAE